MDGKQSRGASVFKQLLLGFRDAALIGIVLLLVFTYIASPFVVSGSSMEPTLHDGDFLFVRKLGYKPDYGDIVTLNAEGVTLVKRIIGLPGDTVSIDYANDVIYVNGTILKEGFAVGDMLNLSNDNQSVSTYTVPFGHVFVLGDNRNHSKDSRDFGAVPVEDIIGSPLLTIRR